MAAKALSLWNGVGNNSPPANWQDVDFDDSGWGAAVATTHADWPTIPAGVVTLWSSATPLSASEQCLIRQKVTMPTGLSEEVTLVERHDYILLGLWINGAMALANTTDQGSDDPIELDLAMLLEDQDNIFAAWLQTTSASLGYHGWQMVIG